MDGGFMFGNGNNSNNALKKVVLVGGIVLGVLGLVSLLLTLIFTGLAEEKERCLATAENAQISTDRCEKPFREVIFVIGDTANTPTPYIAKDDENIINTLYKKNNNEKKEKISIISVSDPDARPKPIESKKIKKISDEIRGMTADEDGADYLEAIRNAAYYAKDKENTLIYVIGSGLSDRGLLNFAGDNLLVEHSTEEIVKAVASKIDENELKGITIYWDGLGDTTEPQEKLPKTLKDKERNIYKEVLGKLGVRKAEFIQSKSSKSLEKNDNVNTYVKTTAIKTDSSTIVVYDTDFTFIPGTADFRNRGTAQNIVRKIVSKYNDSTFIIKPFVSRGICNQDASNHKDLLKARAEATKKLFIEAGASGSDIELLEGGLGDPKMPSGECPNGSGNYGVKESEATKNRKVEITVVRK